MAFEYLTLVIVLLTYFYKLCLTFLAAFLKKPLQIAFWTLAVFFPQVTTSNLCLSLTNYLKNKQT